MHNVTIKISKDIAAAARLPRKNLEWELKKELALHLYSIGVLGFGKARKLADMSTWEFHILLGERKIPRNYDITEFESDLKTIKKWVGKKLS